MEHTYEEKRMYAAVMNMANWLGELGYYVTKDVSRGYVEFYEPNGVDGEGYDVRLSMDCDFRWDRARFLVSEVYKSVNIDTIMKDMRRNFTELMEKLETKTHYYVFSEYVRLEFAIGDVAKNISFKDKRDSFREEHIKKRENEPPLSVFDAFSEEVKAKKKKLNTPQPNQNPNPNL